MRCHHAKTTRLSDGSIPEEQHRLCCSGTTHTAVCRLPGRSTLPGTTRRVLQGVQQQVHCEENALEQCDVYSSEQVWQ